MCLGYTIVNELFDLFVWVFFLDPLLLVLSLDLDPTVFLILD